MCVSTPNQKIPTVPERQAIQQPDNGAPASSDTNNATRRRAIMAGLITGPQGVLGSPTTAKATLG